MMGNPSRTWFISSNELINNIVSVSIDVEQRNFRKDAIRSKRNWSNAMSSSAHTGGAHDRSRILIVAPRCGRIGNNAMGTALAFARQSRDSLYRASSHAVRIPRTCSKFKSPEPDLSQQRERHLIQEEGHAKNNNYTFKDSVIVFSFHRIIYILFAG